MSFSTLVAAVGRCLSAALMAVTIAGPASAVTINFDDVVPAGGGAVFPGNQYAPQGVTFTSGAIPTGLNVGDIFTLSNPVAAFGILANDNAISDPNFAVSLGVFGTDNDILMSFATPTPTLSLQTDDAPGETPDVVRLLALAATGNANEYTVLAIASGLDNAVSAPDNILSLNVPGGFSFAVFEVTTEAEGFDNLTFVPEPTSLALLAPVLLLLRRRRR